MKFMLTHIGLAKFIIGCITMQVTSSRAMHRTSGHWASLGLSTTANNPPTIRWRTCNKQKHHIFILHANSLINELEGFSSGDSTHTLYSHSGDINAGWSSLETVRWCFKRSSLSSDDSVPMTSTPIAAWFLLKRSRWSPTKSTTSLEQ